MADQQDTATSAAPSSPSRMSRLWELVGREFGHIRERFFGVFRFDRERPSIKLSKFQRAFNEKLVLDPFKMEAELNAFRRGVEDGSQGHPDNKDTEYNKFHRDLINYAERKINLLSATRVEILSRLSVEIGKISIPDILPDLDLIFQRAVKVDIKRVKDHCFRQLRDRRMALAQEARAYALFRTQNHRTTEPITVSLGNILKGVSLIFILIMIELSINTFLLSDATSFGVYGGLAFSVITALATIPISLLSGFLLWRGKNKLTWKNNDYRLAASAYFCLALLVIYGIAIVSINALAASIRLSLFDSQNSLDVTTTAINGLLNNPFSWCSNIISLGLFLIGMAGSMVAFWEGATLFSDPYPGYSKRKKQLDVSRERYEESDDVLYNEFENIFEEAKERMEAIAESNDSLIEQCQKQLKLYQSLANIHQSEMLRAVAVVNMVARTYREANIAHRGGAHPPPYFSIPIGLQNFHGFRVTSIDSQLNELVIRNGEARKKITEYLQKLHDQEEIERRRLDAAKEKIFGDARYKTNNAAPVMGADQADDYDF